MPCDSCEVGFVVLPMDLMISVLLDFVGNSHRLLSAMDIACAPSIRCAWLAVLSSNCMALCEARSYMEPRIPEFVQWINARQVKLRALTVNSNNVQHYSTLNEDTLQHLHELRIRDTDASHWKVASTAFRVLLSNCLSLKRLSIARLQQSNKKSSLDGLFAHVASPLCFLSYDGQFNSSHHMANVLIGRVQATLKELELKNCTSCPAMVKAMRACHALQKLTIGTWRQPLAEVTSCLAVLPALRDLTIRNLDIAWQDQPGHDEQLATVLAHCPALHRLCFQLEYYKVNYRDFPLIIQACPQLNCLDILPTLVFRIVDSALHGKTCVVVLDAQHSYAPTPPHAVLALVVSACSVPLSVVRVLHKIYGNKRDAWMAIARAAGAALELFDGNSICIDEQWSSADLSAVLSQCAGLTSLHLEDDSQPYACKLKDNHLLTVAERMQQLCELSISRARTITDAGLLSVLQQCGPRLTKLSLQECKKISRQSLQGVVDLCPNMQQLTLLRTSITLADLLQILLLPDHKHLRKLRKLTLGVGTYNQLLKRADLSDDWIAVLC